MPTFLRRVAPALGLFFLAPFVSEYLLGDFPLTKIGYLFILGPMYGGGAILIREVARRMGKGWPTIFVFAFAYAVFEEAFTTQTLFNPNYLNLNLHLLEPAFIPALGISAWWTIFVLTLHTIWSISTSIALVEACVPDRASTPWLGAFGLTTDTILFVLAAVASTRFTIQHDHFIATTRQFVASAIICLGAILIACVLPQHASSRDENPAPSPWMAGALSLIAGSIFLVIPKAWAWGAVAFYLALDAIILLTVVKISRRSGWNARHRLALAGGAALAYAWHAFLQNPVDGTTGLTIRVSNAICAVIVIALLIFAARRVSQYALLTHN